MFEPSGFWMTATILQTKMYAMVRKEKINEYTVRVSLPCVSKR